jgi:hypothetical protein
MSTIENIDNHGAASLRQPLRPTDVLRVRLECPCGDRWSAIGGGETVGAAIAFALASAPADTAWRVVGWTDVFGE